MRITAILVGGGIVVLLLASLAYGLLRPTGSAASLVGRPAPDLTLRTFEGRDLRLADLRGQPLVVNFWASWCIPCREEAPALNAAARRYEGLVRFVGVDIQDSEPAARAYQAEVASPYPVGVAVSGSHRDFGVAAPPETFFLDRRGTVVSHVRGPLDQRRLELHIGQLLTQPERQALSSAQPARR